MPDLILPATLIAERYRDEAWAVVTIVLAVLAAALVGRALSGRARKLAAAVTGGELSPVVDTRLTLPAAAWRGGDHRHRDRHRARAGVAS